LLALNEALILIISWFLCRQRKNLYIEKEHLLRCPYGSKIDLSPREMIQDLSNCVDCNYRYTDRISLLLENYSVDDDPDANLSFPLHISQTIWGPSWKRFHKIDHNLPLV
jgi:hypothetical protein